ncbi:negative regulator of systemic acquired resistance SNI1 isoform X2 [Phalaenopsis equestris]|uniref:negative regulator of systemic acquired resistance SNI1 isoform X2 n=1 Tax=Phalaenopsis equestris TaxID=78828 RepID=UPI0009E5F886|nr:negative regulator of systemic acquired resistance SNI1 isoform X2 [Phalaenopsis equestris]
MDNLRKNSHRLEGNTLAILDSSGIREACDIHEDRLSFLDAVRGASLASITPSPPTWKMYDAILRILKEGNSLELAVASFQLLTDLEKRYPSVYLRESDNLETDSSGAWVPVVNKEAWSPFIVETRNCSGEASQLCRDSKSLLNSASFSILTEEIAIGGHSTIKIVQNMLLFQYVVRSLEADFLPRHTFCKETFNWDFLKESVLCKLVAYRKMNYKSIVHGCMSIISTRFFHKTNICFKDLSDKDGISADLPTSCYVGLSFAFPEIQRKTCDAAQKLLILIMELDVIRKEADTFGLTSRSDGFRIPIIDTVLDELTYNKDQLSPFLEAFGEPKWKLEIILLYFGKYYSRPSTRTRRTNTSPNNETFEGILNCFSNPVISGGILRKVTSEVACLLLAQAFKCYLSLQHDPKNVAFVAEKIGSSTLPEICNGLVAALKNLRKFDDLELTSFQKQALTTAAALASMKS